jgi:hypothetical protein
MIFIPSLTVYNLLGEMVLQTPLANKVDLTSLRTGIYFLEFSNNSVTSIKKNIKE